MSVTDFRQLLADAFGRVAAQLDTLEQRLPPELVGLASPEEAQPIIQRAIDDVKRELYDARDVPDEGDESEAAA